MIGIARSLAGMMTPGRLARASVMWGRKGRLSRGLNGTPLSTPTRSSSRSTCSARSTVCVAPSPMPAAMTVAGPRGGKVTSPRALSVKLASIPATAAPCTALLEAMMAPCNPRSSISPRNASVTCMPSGRVQRRPGLDPRSVAQASVSASLKACDKGTAMNTRTARPSTASPVSRGRAPRDSPWERSSVLRHPYRLPRLSARHLRIACHTSTSRPTRPTV